MCGVEKPITEYYRIAKYKDGRNRTCKVCSNALNKEWYLRNREKQLRLKEKWREERRFAMRRMVWEYLEKHPCTKCGEKDPIVLEFDHQRDKVATVSRLATYGYNPDRIMKEIEKCVILCANCHRRKTAKQFGWHKGQKVEENGNESL